MKIIKIKSFFVYFYIFLINEQLEKPMSHGQPGKCAVLFSFLDIELFSVKLSE